jgi:hypothetical protein
MLLTFLGTGNERGEEARAFSSFVVNDRILIECAPDVLQQLNRAGMSSDQIGLVAVSSFRAERCFGLPLFLLDQARARRSSDLVIAGPAQVRERAETLCDFAYPNLAGLMHYSRRFVEFTDEPLEKLEIVGIESMQASSTFVPESFALWLDTTNGSVVYTNDPILAEPGQLTVTEASAVVIDCTAGSGDPDWLAYLATLGENLSSKVLITGFTGDQRTVSPCQVVNDLDRIEV